MKAIYACKLYKASTRKDKIQAAIADPVNSELVEQLATYLDEEYQVPVKDEASPEGSQPNTSESSPEGSEGSSSSSGGSRFSGSGGSFGGSGGGVIDGDLGDELSEGEGDDSGEEISTEPTPGGPPPEEDPDGDIVEESTRVKGKTISASSNMNINLDNLSTLVEEIKGHLNLREETSGVSRVRVKDNELWIHYNDNINLNNVMIHVVELLEASGYVYLEFNRLARSENAVVFEISIADTGEE